jgi:hypothetical protein
MSSFTHPIASHAFQLLLKQRLDLANLNTGNSSGLNNDNRPGTWVSLFKDPPGHYIFFYFYHDTNKIMLCDRCRCDPAKTRQVEWVNEEVPSMTAEEVVDYIMRRLGFIKEAGA